MHVSLPIRLPTAASRIFPYFLFFSFEIAHVLAIIGLDLQNIAAHRRQTGQGLRVGNRESGKPAPDAGWVAGDFSDGETMIGED